MLDASDDECIYLLHQIELLDQSEDVIFDSSNIGLNSEYLSGSHDGFYLQSKPARVIF